jgi:hypothetical protein
MKRVTRIITLTIRDLVTLKYVKMVDNGSCLGIFVSITLTEKKQEETFIQNLIFRHAPVKRNMIYKAKG